MKRGRGPFGLPDFARGKAAIAYAVFGALWTVVAIVSKQHWLIVLIGVFIMARGIMRAIGNAVAKKKGEEESLFVYKKFKESINEYKGENDNQ